jgi:hypothetical protein
MTPLRRLAALAGVLSLCACASGQHRDPVNLQPEYIDCSKVDCAACPAGQHLSDIPPCCRCTLNLGIDSNQGG